MASELIYRHEPQARFRMFYKCHRQHAVCTIHCVSSLYYGIRVQALFTTKKNIQFLSPRHENGNHLTTENSLHLPQATRKSTVGIK